MDDNERAIGRYPEGVEIYTPIWNEELQWYENKYGIFLVGKLEEEQSAFVELDEDDFVLQAKNVTQEYIDEGWMGDPSKWVQTSFGNWFRHHHAGYMDKYDRENDIFIAIQKYQSWTLDENFVWQPPIPRPEETEWDGTFLHYKAREKSKTQDWSWDEGKLRWVPWAILWEEEQQYYIGQENKMGGDCGSGEYEED